MLRRIHCDHEEFRQLLADGWRILSIGNRIALLFKGRLPLGFDPA